MRTILLGLVATVTCLLPAADEPVSAARAILDQQGGAVVHAILTVKQPVFRGRGGAGGGRDAAPADPAAPAETRDREIEVPATVIDAAGLAVFPTEALDGFAGRMRRMLPGGVGEVRMSVAGSGGGEVSAAALVLADGTRLEAEVTQRDETVGLGLLKLKAPPAKPLASLAPPTAPPTLRLLDPVVVIGRCDSELGRAPRLLLGHIQAVTEKPKGGWLLTLADTEGLVGCPAFTLDGTPLGILCDRAPGERRGRVCWIMPDIQVRDLAARPKAAPAVAPQPATPPPPPGAPGF